MDKALYCYTWRSDRYAFDLLLQSYEVKAQTHTCQTSMGSNIGPCPAIKFLQFDGLTSLKTFDLITLVSLLFDGLVFHVLYSYEKLTLSFFRSIIFLIGLTLWNKQKKMSLTMTGGASISVLLFVILNHLWSCHQSCQNSLDFRNVFTPRGFYLPTLCVWGHI